MERRAVDALGGAVGALVVELLELTRLQRLAELQQTVEKFLARAQREENVSVFADFEK